MDCSTHCDNGRNHYVIRAVNSELYLARSSVNEKKRADRDCNKPVTGSNVIIEHQCDRLILLNMHANRVKRNMIDEQR